MSDKLIYADALLEAGRNTSQFQQHLADEYDLECLIVGMPAVDAVEVVRCKDCRMFQPKTTEFLQHCERTDLFVRNNDFCSFGDRGEDNAVD